MINENEMVADTSSLRRWGAGERLMKGAFARQNVKCGALSCVHHATQFGVDAILCALKSPYINTEGACADFAPHVDTPIESVGQRAMRVARACFAATDLSESRRELALMISAVFARELDDLAPDDAERVFGEWRALAESGDWAAAVIAAMPSDGDGEWRKGADGLKHDETVLACWREHFAGAAVDQYEVGHLTAIKNDGCPLVVWRSYGREDMPIDQRTLVAWMPVPSAPTA